MAVPWVRFTENALVPKIMLQFQNGDTSWHQGDSAGIFMYSAGIFMYDRIQNKVPKNKFGRHGTTRGLQTNKIGTVLCLARCVIFNIVKGQLCPQSLCGWIGDCPGNERD